MVWDGSVRIARRAVKQAVLPQATACEATHIYAEAYGRAQEFHRFVKTLETYIGTVDARMLLLSTDGDHYRYLKVAGAE